MSRMPGGPRWRQLLLQRYQARASPVTSSRKTVEHESHTLCCDCDKQCLCDWICAQAAVQPALGLWRAQQGLLMALSRPNLMQVQRRVLEQRQQQKRRPQQAGPRHHFHRCRCHRQSSSAAHALCPAGMLASCLSTLPHCEWLASERAQHQAVHAAHNNLEPGGAAECMRYVKRT